MHVTREIRLRIVEAREMFAKKRRALSRRRFLIGKKASILWHLSKLLTREIQEWLKGKY